MGDYGTNLPQQGDVYHYDGPNGGTINMVSGDLEMTTGIESALYDCLFGGNRTDDGSAATVLEQWCGNEGEREEYRSRGKFQSMLDGRPLTSALIPQLEEAGRSDIVNQMPRAVVKDASVSVYITGPKRIDVSIEVEHQDGTIYTTELKGIAT